MIDRGLFLIDLESLQQGLGERQYPIDDEWIICRLICLALTNAAPSKAILIGSPSPTGLISKLLKALNIDCIESTPNTQARVVWGYLGEKVDLLEVQANRWTRIYEPNNSYTNINLLKYEDLKKRWGGNPSLGIEILKASEAVPRNVAIRIITKLGTVENAKQNLKKIQRIIHRDAIKELNTRELELNTLPDIGDISVPDADEFYTLIPELIKLKDRLEECKRKDYHIVTKDIDKVSTLLGGEKILAIDTETTGLDTQNDDLVGISISPKKDVSYYFPVAAFKPDEYYKAIMRILSSSNIKKVMHNAYFDIEILENNGFTVNGVDFDTMLAAYVLCYPKVGLKPLASSLLSMQMTTFEDLLGEVKTIKDVPIEISGPYACADADATIGIYEILKSQLQETPSLQDVFNVEMQVMHVLREMTREGVEINIDRLEEIKAGFDGEDGYIRKAEQEVYQLAGEEFNIDSPPQLSKILFQKLRLTKTKKTESGDYTTEAKYLEGIAHEHPIVSKTLNVKKLITMREHIERIINAVDSATGKIHPDWKQALVVSGRLTVNPNLQNIPAPGDDSFGELGYAIRSAFYCSDPDYILLGADYSQLEARLLAHYAGDEGLIEGYNKEEDEEFDIHRYIASVINEIPEDEVTDDQRRAAKPFTFGISYGLTEYGYSIRQKVSREQAREFINAFFIKFPRIKEWQEIIVSQSRKLGYAETVDGRRRYIPNLNAPDDNTRSAAERECINMPIQGSASGIIKKAMVEISERSKNQGIKMALLLQVHDELLYKVHKDDLESLQELVEEIMPNVVQLKVPLRVAIKSGRNWAECH